MIEIPLYFFIWGYAAVVLFLVIFLFIDLFHLVHTGTLTMASFIVTVGCGAAIVLIFWATWVLLQDTDWGLSITLWDNNWFGTVFSTKQIYSPFKP